MDRNITMGKSEICLIETFWQSPLGIKNVTLLIIITDKLVKYPGSSNSPQKQKKLSKFLVRIKLEMYNEEILDNPQPPAERQKSKFKLNDNKNTI